jgi:hypothetical protein
MSTLERVLSGAQESVRNTMPSRMLENLRVPMMSFCTLDLKNFDGGSGWFPGCGHHVRMQFLSEGSLFADSVGKAKQAGGTLLDCQVMVTMQLNQFLFPCLRLKLVPSTADSTHGFGYKVVCRSDCSVPT